MSGADPDMERPGEELDAWSLARALWRRRKIILVTTIVVVGAAAAIVATITPRYASQAKILIENREPSFVRPESDRDLSILDEAAVLSQVEILSSRDLGATVVDALSLADRAEFNRDPNQRSMIRRALHGLGLISPSPEAAINERVAEAYFDRLSVHPIDRSRVIAVNFSSEDAELAATVANRLVDAYIALQRTAKSDSNQEAVDWLAREIDQLRGKVADAEDAVAQYRSDSGIFESSRDRSLSEQQLSEVNAELVRASAAKSEAQAKARLIKRLLDQPGGIEEAADVINSPLIQRLREQQAAVSREHAELSATLLSGHPRMRELSAELADLERRIASEAAKIARGLENAADVAGAREEAIRSSLAELKQETGETTKSEVKLRALEREATAQRETLEALLRRYREASARQDVAAQPANVRIISRATVAATPSYPPRGPILALASISGVLLGFLGAFFAEVVHPSAPSAGAAVGRGLRRMPAAPDAGVGDPRHEPDLSDRVEPSSMQIGRRLIQLVQSRRVRRVALVSIEGAVRVQEIAMRIADGVAAGGVIPVVVDASLSGSGAPGAKGLFSLLAGQATLGEVMHARGQGKPVMISAGEPPPDSDALLTSGRVALVLDALAHRFELAIVIAGDLGRGAVPLKITGAAELVLLLVASNELDGARLKQALKALRDAGITHAAVVSHGPGGLTFYDQLAVKGALSDAA